MSYAPVMKICIFTCALHISHTMPNAARIFPYFFFIAGLFRIDVGIFFYLLL